MRKMRVEIARVMGYDEEYCGRKPLNIQGPSLAKETSKC
jgi:hypothetical protein